jgi:hypothetical protein
MLVLAIRTLEWQPGPMKINTVYDLSALMVALEIEGPPTELTEAIRRAADVSSAHRDLDEALAAIKLLRRLTSGWDETRIEDSDLTTIVGSLMTATIILYARATITSSDARRPWFGEGRLPRVLRPTHDELIRLRNKEVAHFGRGHPVDGTPLLEEALVLRPFDPVHPIGHLSSRAHNRAALARRTEELVEAVLKIALQSANKRHTEVFMIIEKLAASGDPTMARLGTMPVTEPRLLAAEAPTQSEAPRPGAARTFSRTAVIELHGDEDAT